MLMGEETAHLGAVPGPRVSAPSITCIIFSNLLLCGATTRTHISWSACNIAPAMQPCGNVEGPYEATFQTALPSLLRALV